MDATILDDVHQKSRMPWRAQSLAIRALSVRLVTLLAVAMGHISTYRTRRTFLIWDTNCSLWTKGNMGSLKPCNNS
eukprot:XP_001705892.1 Hypothetical protein GL50803_93722 [Giardia lamblia ATCC 50803]